MSLLSLTLYAVQKTKHLFPFWFPVIKLKGGFGFIVHDDIVVPDEYQDRNDLHEKYVKILNFLENGENLRK